MPRRPTGSIYQSFGRWYVSVAMSGGKKASFGMDWTKTETEADIRRIVVADLAHRLRKLGREDLVRPVCERAANAFEADIPKLVALVDGLVNGKETAPLVVEPTEEPEYLQGDDVWTVERFGNYWTSNKLAEESGGNVAIIDQSDNLGRLKKHVYPVVYQGLKIADTPLHKFTKAHAKHIVRQSSLSAGSRNHVGNVLKRLFRLAHEECELIPENPLRDWRSPPKNPEKQGAYLYPTEEASLMACQKVPVVRRVLFGFAAREGIRRGRIVRLQWPKLQLTGFGRKGVAIVPGKPNKPGVHWVLDEGTAEALRRWRRICPSTTWVFPAEALPGYVRRRAGSHLYVHHFARDLRDALKTAGVTRPELFDPDDGFKHIVGHDLRATYVTLARANGESDATIRQRTRHSTTGMIDKYDHAVGIFTELNCGLLVPLHEAIPELAEMESSEEWKAAAAE
jgi:integrase